MPVRILLVDDEPQILAALRRQLVRRGHEVATAPDAKTALAQLESFLPDVVICDFRLPGMNGVELLAEVSKVQPTARLALLSGLAEVGDAEFRGRFFRKPWNETELFSFCAQGPLP